MEDNKPEGCPLLQMRSAFLIGVVFFNQHSEIWYVNFTSCAKANLFEFESQGAIVIPPIAKLMEGV